MSVRLPLIAANWKMHKTIPEARQLSREVKQGLVPAPAAEVVLAPPYTALAAVAEELAGSPVGLAGQDTFWKEAGAFTGAISPPMLRDAGCRYVIVGHSERRQYFGETDHTVNLKLKAAREGGLRLIFCLGETLEEREAGQTMAKVREQLTQGLAEMSNLTGDELVIAYEPVWAIGTGRTATPEQAQEVHAFIRAELAGIIRAPATIRILYGGSVSPDNAAALLAQADIDGALVGGASLKAGSFLGIIRAAG